LNAKPAAGGWKLRGYTLNMLWGRSRFWLIPFMAASLVAVACGDDRPDREIQQAQSAIDAAKTAGADEYARDEVTAAEKALANAREAVGQRDYRLALTNALESRERAQNAAKEAADQRAIARTNIERTMRDTIAALARTRARLKTAENSRVPEHALASPRQAITDADRAVQEARAAFDKGDYLGAQRTLEAANAHLSAGARDLDAPARPPARRRR